jgi:hypothetical protein
MRVVGVHDRVALAAGDEPAIDREGDCAGDEKADAEEAGVAARCRGRKSALRSSQRLA